MSGRSLWQGRVNAMVMAGPDCSSSALDFIFFLPPLPRDHQKYVAVGNAGRKGLDREIGCTKLGTQRLATVRQWLVLVRRAGASTLRSWLCLRRIAWRQSQFLNDGRTALSQEYSGDGLICV